MATKAKTTTKKAPKSLSDYVTKAKVEYPSYVIEVDGTEVEFYNPLMISHDRRERVFELIEQINTSNKGDDGKVDDPKEVGRLAANMLEFLTLVGDDNASLVTDQISGQVPVIVSVFQDYFQEVGLGEVSVSED